MGRGNYYRYNAKASTGDLLSVSLADIRRFSRLKPAWGYVLKWSRSGTEVGAVNYDLSEDSITFRYTNTPYGGEPVAVRVTVPFNSTACHFGGYRKWFGCGCGRRVSRLFIKGKRVACRHCLNLAYSCQREDQIDRLMRKVDKKKFKLEKERFKPKGMHYHTYHRLVGEIQRLELKRWLLVDSECARRFGGTVF